MIYKKYDCTKAIDYIHEKNRMCITIDNVECKGCPLSNISSGCGDYCTEESIKRVQEWLTTWT